MPLVLKILLIIICVILAAVLLLLIVLSIAEYRPDDVETVAVTASDDSEARTLSSGDTITIVSWNTGYGALGKTADFFMDGGTMVKTADEEGVESNMEGIEEAVSDLSPDILFLQEVDTNSSRSSHIDESGEYADEFSDILGESAFAYNFKVLFVPYPIPPIGTVNSGIQTLSSYGISSAERIQLPCSFKWPVRIANLKRCLLVSRIPIEGSGGKELVAINLHLEAYDQGEGKAAQTAALKEFMQEEVDKGNYVIAGGDFNQTFSNLDTSAYPQFEDCWQSGLIDVSEFGDSFSFYMDSSVPTCRSLDRPYNGESPDEFQFYVIDGFIVSDNIEVISEETIDEGFEYTDHNPAVIEIKLD